MEYEVNLTVDLIQLPLTTIQGYFLLLIPRGQAGIFRILIKCSK
jgi:hypothetical protein